jgi:hypothetical protein
LGLIKQFVEDASSMDRVEWMILCAAFVVVAGGYVAATGPSPEAPAIRADRSH